MIDNINRPKAWIPPTTTAATAVQLNGPAYLVRMDAWTPNFCRTVRATLNGTASSETLDPSPELQHAIGLLIAQADHEHFHARVRRVEELKALRYSEGDFMRRHHDNEHEGALLPGRITRVPRIPFALQMYLSEPGEDYDGGQLIIGDEVLQPPIGTAVFLRGDVPHEVRPITRGHRIALKAIVTVRP